MANSALYEGWVMHRRVRPRYHRFKYRVFAMLLDLDELPGLDKRLSLFSWNRRGLLSFHDRDHGDGRDLKLWLDDLLARADYVICLAIANEETENLLDAAAFARMKPDAFFINMSRGNLVDEAALAKALAEGRIAGAAMDVGRAPDQMPSPELARLPNVIATPHIGGLTPPASESQAMDTVRQVEALVKGEIPPGAVNVANWTRRS